MEALRLDLSRIAHPHLGTVDALARARLEGGRCGFELRLQGVGPRLRELLDLAGLREVLGVGLPLEPVRHPEEREEPGRVEEEDDPGDPAV